MSSLAQKQRRSTPLLRSLAFNMARQTEKLNVKNCADLLYAMAVLNFPDDMLLEKTCEDLCECVTSNQKPAVIGSILTSLGLLRYKNKGKNWNVFFLNTLWPTLAMTGARFLFLTLKI